MIVIQQVKKFSALFVESEASSPWSQKCATGGNEKLIFV